MEVAMQTRELGKSGVRVSEVGFGAWHFEGDAAVMQRALDLGSTLIDTAESYQTEIQVAIALQGRRNEAFIATKVSPENFRYADVMKAADQSLRNLRIDTIDLYQLHAPNGSIPIDETMRAMDDLVRAGKVRFVGVSNFSAQELATAEVALGKGRIVENQIKYSIFDHQFADTVIPYCQEHGIAILAYSPLESAQYRAELDRNPLLQELLRTMSQESGKTPVQILLSWGLHQPNVITIPATNNVAHLEENCGASGWRLSEEQYTALNASVNTRPSWYWWR
jgi:diketogulonate reductase-like aldo/keto reductase